MKQTEGPLSEGCVHIMHKNLRNFHFFERIFSINVLNLRLQAAAGLVGPAALGGLGPLAAGRFAARFGWLVG